MTENNSKPCLVQTPQGFSVSYNERFLYSKYNPSKAILQTIQNIQILPNTLILCCSPVLSYGLFELAQKLPQDCFILLCEADNNLLELQRQQIKELPENCARLSLQQLYELPQMLNGGKWELEDGKKLPPPHNFRRVQRIDFSAGVQFSSAFYNDLHSACISSVKTFWANRITLVRFGRKYSRNLFTNLHKLPQTTPITNYFGKVSKPIIVIGAGESTDKILQKLQTKSQQFFIICVDTVLPVLLKKGISPDAVFIEEAQTVIAKAFIGALNKNLHIFAGLSSLPLLSHIFPLNQITFFTTLYTDCTFLRNLQKQNLLPPVNAALGSVGLTAVEYALKFRTDSSIPVYICGLDFSYSIGATHTKGAMAHLQRLISTTRLQPVENYPAAFGIGTEQFVNNEGQKQITTQNLHNYALLFKNRYYEVQNLFTLSKSGIDLSLSFANFDSINATGTFTPGNNSNITENSISNFFENERKALEELRDLLSGKIPLPQAELSARIKEIAQPREYLFLHFADGYAFSMELSFLKRIRSEIDFFLKLF